MDSMKVYFVTSSDYSIEYAAVIAAVSEEDAIAFATADAGYALADVKAMAIETPVATGVLVSA